MKTIKEFTLIVLLFSTTILLAAPSEPVLVSMSAAYWDVPKDAVFESFDDRETLKLNGKAFLKEVSLQDGSISVDVYANTKRSFAGILFRKKDNSMEEVYMRMHKSSQVDAVQYSPTFRGELTWQLYREHQARVSLKNAGWNTLRIDIKGDAASVYVNDELAMEVNDLRTDHKEGAIGLFALFGNRFSNFQYQAKEYHPEEKTKVLQYAEGLISEWSISGAKMYSTDTGLKDFANDSFQKVATEESGLLAFSKFLDKPSSGEFEKNQEACVLARVSVFSEEKRYARLAVDFSDKIFLFVNGNPVFRGNNAFRTKGVQYMGHLSLDANHLYIPLEKGENVIECLVIDRANGWGLMAKWLD